MPWTSTQSTRRFDYYPQATSFVPSYPSSLPLATQPSASSLFYHNTPITPAIISGCLAPGSSLYPEQIIGQRCLVPASPYLRAVCADTSIECADSNLKQLTTLSSLLSRRSSLLDPTRPNSTRLPPPLLHPQPFRTILAWTPGTNRGTSASLQVAVQRSSLWL